MRSATRAFTTSTSTAGTRPRPPARGTSRCATIPRSALAIDSRTWRWRCGSNISTSRSIVSVALTVDEPGEHEVAGLGRLQRGPDLVGVARRWLTITTSGSWRSTCSSAECALGVSRPTSRWSTIARLSACSTSIGSSIVTTWQSRPAFTWSTIAASVAVFPEPGEPRDEHEAVGLLGEPAHRWRQVTTRRTRGRPAARGAARDRSTRAGGTRSRGSGRARRSRRCSPTRRRGPQLFGARRRHHGGRDPLGVGGLDGVERRLAQVPVDAQPRARRRPSRGRRTRPGPRRSAAVGRGRARRLQSVGQASGTAVGRRDPSLSTRRAHACRPRIAARRRRLPWIAHARTALRSGRRPHAAPRSGPRPAGAVVGRPRHRTPRRRARRAARRQAGGAQLRRPRPARSASAASSRTP